MLNQEQIQQFHRDGYLRGNRVLNDEQVDILCAEIERVIADSETPAGSLPQYES